MCFKLKCFKYVYNIYILPLIHPFNIFIEGLLCVTILGSGNAEIRLSPCVSWHMPVKEIA